MICDGPWTSVFMEPFSQMIHSRFETPHTPLHIQEPSTFRELYPVANPPPAPTTFIHSPNPQPIAGDNPLVSMTWRFTLAEEEYL